MANPERALKLTSKDLNPTKDGKLPDNPRYYQFKEEVADKFYNATLITYTRPDGTEVVLKDLYSRSI